LLASHRRRKHSAYLSGSNQYISDPIATTNAMGTHEARRLDGQNRYQKKTKEATHSQGTNARNQSTLKRSTVRNGIANSELLIS
jgi:hypothetical protein